MRNKKAYQYGYSAWETAYAGNPEYGPDCCEDPYGYDYWYDDDDWSFPDDPDVFKTKSLVKHIIKSSDKNFIKLKLKNVKRNINCKVFFEDIIAGNFLIQIFCDKLLADRFLLESIFDYENKNFFKINISELQDSEYKWISVSDDPRFTMTKWARKIDTFIFSEFCLEEIVDIISHCVKLERVKSFF